MKIENGKLIYRRGFRKIEKSLEEFVWAYVQKEDVKANMC